jgi:hypothetical protein
MGVKLVDGTMGSEFDLHEHMSAKPRGRVVGSASQY